MLNFLRNDELFVLNDTVLIETLKLEAKFFQLPLMEEKLDKTRDKMRFSNNWAYLSVMEEVREALVALKYTLQEFSGSHKDLRSDLRTQRRR